ncbi:MAG: Flp family type IVb pilin [Bdellovibrionota bacterium]
MLRKRNQKGLTLLEYCAGAAVVAVIVFAVLQAMGGKLQTAATNIGDWAVDRSGDLPTGITLDAGTTGGGSGGGN